MFREALERHLLSWFEMQVVMPYRFCPAWRREGRRRPLRGKPWALEGGWGSFLGEVNVFFFCKCFFAHPFALGSWEQTLQVVHPPNSCLSAQAPLEPEARCPAQSFPRVGSSGRGGGPVMAWGLAFSPVRIP